MPRKKITDKERLDWIAQHTLLQRHEGTHGLEKVNRERLNRVIDVEIRKTTKGGG